MVRWERRFQAWSWEEERSRWGLRMARRRHRARMTLSNRDWSKTTVSLVSPNIFCSTPRSLD
eukprot:3668243-Pleurochrysis_carterae.AAC.1